MASREHRPGRVQLCKNYANRNCIEKSIYSGEQERFRGGSVGVENETISVQRKGYFDLMKKTGEIMEIQ